MATTRDFKSLGEVAVDANEVSSPGERTEGESYRNIEFTTFQQNRGKQYSFVPVSENVNQQLYNQSQFTNSIDSQGIPGWKDSVTYAKAAAVFGSDGKLYLSKREENINVDPVDDEYSPDWWELFEGGAEIASKFASQVPGSEGSRLVGNTQRLYPPDKVIPMPTIGYKRETIKESLDRNTRLFEQMENVEILASLGAATININHDYPSSAVDQNFADSFNINTIDITAYSKTAPQPGGTTIKIGYLTINFINPIPTPYLYSATIFPENGLVSALVGDEVVIFPDIGGRPFYGVTSSSVANVTANSIDIGCLVLARPPDSFSPEWPSDWGNENPTTRILWTINLFCYRIL